MKTPFGEDRFYVILSEGAYSAYEPIYYVGVQPLGEKEYEQYGKDLGDRLYTEFEKMPKRPIKDTTGLILALDGEMTESYNPLTGDTVYSKDLSPRFFKEMDEWLRELGFTPIEKDLPEINVSYSELPHS